MKRRATEEAVIKVSSHTLDHPTASCRQLFKAVHARIHLHPSWTEILIVFGRGGKYMGGTIKAAVENATSMESTCYDLSG